MAKRNIHMTTEDITFILPSYNTLNYLLMAYRSIREYYPKNEIIILDDGSTDGSQEWLTGTRSEFAGHIAGQMHHDLNLKAWHNKTGNILGHTVTYDMGIKMATKPLVTIFHSDMICAPTYLENMLKHWAPKTVVCATRIEPTGIYPEGKEKILMPFGIEFHEFKKEDFLNFVSTEQEKSKGVITKGIFAPWLISKNDFLSIGGHDATSFAPYPEEDADLFLRFALAGFNLIQSRDSLCYHWISRGHRSWAKNGVGKDDNMFKFYQMRARRNYLRKWHRWMQFDTWHHPRPHVVYDTAFILRNLKTTDFLHAVEPWSSIVYVDNWDIALEYIKHEQPTTRVDLTNRIRQIPSGESFNPPADIILEFSENDFMIDGKESLGIIQNLSEIIKDSAEPNSEMELGVFKLKTNAIKDISSTLIKI